MASAKRIFWDHSLSDSLRGHLQQVFAEIDNFDVDYILKVNIEELTAHFVDRYRIDPLVLNTDGICIADKGETKIDKTHDIQIRRGSTRRTYLT